MRFKYRTMFSLDDLTSFYRLYFSLYRIEHDVSVDPESSFWQCELAVQPGTDAQKSLLRKAFKGMEITVDRDGSLLIKSPICPIKSHPQIDKLFGGCEAFVSGLVGCDFQLQVVIAPNDEDYRTAQDSGFVKADTDGQAHCGGSPETGGGGKAHNLIASGDHDGAGTEETDTAYYLSAHSYGIARMEHLENVLIRKHYKTGAYAHQHVSS